MNRDFFKILPARFARLMSESHGEKGVRWLAGLPRMIEEIEENWALKVDRPFANLSYHFVAPCVCAGGGGEAVLKIGFPENDSPIFNEAEMLKCLKGEGAAQFLRLDAPRFALLLEKLTPGEHLKTAFPQNDAKAVEIAVEVLRKIRREVPAEHDFISLEKWFAGFEKAKNTKFPARAVSKAQKFYEDLAKAEKFLIHGDFHHENILAAEGESFLAIDPKGVVGQLGYEISVFLNNHVWWLQNDRRLRAKLGRAVLEFSEAFAIDARVLRKWAFAQAVLSAWWTFEENGENWKNDLALAEIWEV